MTADTDFAIVPFVSIVPIVSNKITRDERDLSDRETEGGCYQPLHATSLWSHGPMVLKKNSGHVSAIIINS